MNFMKKKMFGVGLVEDSAVSLNILQESPLEPNNPSQGSPRTIRKHR